MQQLFELQPTLLQKLLRSIFGGEVSWQRTRSSHHVGREVSRIGFSYHYHFGKVKVSPFSIEVHYLVLNREFLL
jgi:hypothetical protein